MMLELSLLLTVAPALLNSLAVSAILLTVALGFTAFAAWLTGENRWTYSHAGAWEPGTPGATCQNLCVNPLATTHVQYSSSRANRS